MDWLGFTVLPSTGGVEGAATGLDGAGGANPAGPALGCTDAFVGSYAVFFAVDFLEIFLADFLNEDSSVAPEIGATSWTGGAT
jgi:hypothetical protein